MLFVLSLTWQRFSIAQQVSHVNRLMQERVESVGLSQKIIFNFASLGAGEKLLPFDEDKSQIPPDVLDSLRQHHHQMVQMLRNEVHFQANRDMLEMLAELKSAGHKLAAVLPSDTKNLENLLEDTRARDFFDDSVYGYDRQAEQMSGNYTLAGLFSTAAIAMQVDLDDTLIVADSPEAIEDAVPIKPLAVVGYVDPYTPWAEQDMRLKEMTQAGANYTAVGGHTVAALPWHITGQAQKEAQRDIAKAMGRRDMH